MPSRHILKEDTADSYYHVYIRGGNHLRIFRDDADFEKMLQLFARYLSLAETKNSAGVSFPNYYNKLELLAFSLLPDRIHLLVYQHQKGAMAAFMRSILTSYSMYFNKQHHRSGPLFASRYKAARISDDTYLEHVGRYIHLTPRNWQEYAYTSLPYYLQQVSDEWIRPNRMLEHGVGAADYLAFMADHEQYKQILDILRLELANGSEL